MLDDKRKEYWNEEYVKYWKEKVGDANMSIDVADPTTTDAIYIETINLLKLLKSDTVLEAGCGFGRSLPYLSSIAGEVFGVDISHEMIKEAKLLTKNIDNITLKVSSSEKTSIEKRSIDKVICFAAFDAMHQREALVEFNRICKYNGTVLITGKNNSFASDDKEALAAEIGARKKGHPNYFTDVNLLLESMHLFGFEVVFERYYLRRGDFSVGKSLDVRPERYYEYVLTLKKINEVDSYIDELPVIASLFSKK